MTALTTWLDDNTHFLIALPVVCLLASVAGAVLALALCRAAGLNSRGEEADGPDYYDTDDVMAIADAVAEERRTQAGATS